MADLKNNLFNYATKELSQDAFICWLCSYALEGADTSDLELNKCAKDLICEFIKRELGNDIDCSKVSLKKVEKQFEQIDVLLTAKYDNEIYKIIIEDKIYSSEHDNQLTRYKNSLGKEYSHVVGIYFKTGFQSDLSEVNKAGYHVFNRSDILKTLHDCKSDNAIFKDYKEYWENFERITQSYKDLSVDEWPDWQAVNGFYDEMQSILEGNGYWAGYGYVPNQSGGFWGLWYGDGKNETIEVDDFKSTMYMQIESKWNYEKNHYDIKICLKLQNKSDDRKDERLYKLRDLIIDIQSAYGFERPQRLGFGQTMTVGVYKCSLGDYDVFKTTVLESIERAKSLIIYANAKMKS